MSYTKPKAIHIDLLPSTILPKTAFNKYCILFHTICEMFEFAQEIMTIT